MKHEHSFVTYLESLKEDRGALAALRRGLGQPPGSAPSMYPYVVPRLPASAYPGSWQEQTYYLIAALFALHPVGTAEGNLGNHFARLRDPNAENNDALERRFTAILTADPADMHIYLRQAISFLKSHEETPVNWHRLMWDLLRMGNPEKLADVRQFWARAFWGAPHPENKKPPEPSGG